MTRSGRCQCGAVRYEVKGEAKRVALCHCADCQRSAGAPVVAWAEFRENALQVTQGTPKTFNSSGAARRSFCPDCGTGLFYRNQDFLPGMVDVQLTTLDDTAGLTPTVQYQTAERLPWMQHLEQITAFDRFGE